MNLPLKSTVLFCSADKESFGTSLAGPLQTALLDLTTELSGGAPWAIKIPIGAADQENPVPPELLMAARSALLQGGVPAGPFFDNLSITTEGLDTPEGLRARAQSLQLADFRVGDDPDGPVSETLPLADDCSMASVGLPAIAAEAGGLLVLSAVRPHPFLGMGGALFSLGCGILDRATKLLLHRDVKPSVDVPLCAGCGSCLASCIFDAISISSGRANIDHKLCTGCGACMSACHLGGIGPVNGMYIPRYQRLVAEAAGAVAEKSRAGIRKPLVFANFLAPMPRQSGGSLKRDHFLKAPLGVLLSTDPVALDQATWDLLVEGSVHGLQQWSGFLQEPEPLLDRSAVLGIGRRQYTLINHI